MRYSSRVPRRGEMEERKSLGMDTTKGGILSGPSLCFQRFNSLLHELLNGLGESLYTLFVLLFRHVGEVATEGILTPAIAVEAGTQHEGHLFLNGYLE